MVIVIGTDGIWEARNPRDSMYGKDRLRELIRMHADASAADIAEAVTESLVVYRQSRAQEDDVTLVVVKILD
jgi:sigma-B regulation protein RsbU (phosphoserine phosphatase)